MLDTCLHKIFPHSKHIFYTISSNIPAVGDTVMATAVVRIVETFIAALYSDMVDNNQQYRRLSSLQNCESFLLSKRIHL